MNGMKRLLLASYLVALFLIPLGASAATTSIGWSIGIFGGAPNGGEQTDEANAISGALTTYGYNGGVSGSSNYRNSLIALWQAVERLSRSTG